MISSSPQKYLCRMIFRKYCYKTIRRPSDLPFNRKQPTNSNQIDQKIKETGASLANQIRSRILATGPITVADYMKEVLTNCSDGYYMSRDVFGRDGDFITSPEISQIFGELIAIWCLLEWRKIGSQTPIQIVELGPGRGTLARDLLRVFSKLKMSVKLTWHLVEISPYLSKMQAQRLCSIHEEITNTDLPYYMKGETASGIKFFWYKQLEDVPRQFSIILAHEFFDAMPIHKLQLDNGIWKEILIDADPKDDKQFRFVISKEQTPISRIFQPNENEKRQCLEYSVETDRIISMIAERLESDGGMSLIIDYGHLGEKSDTFRVRKSRRTKDAIRLSIYLQAFKKHNLHDPLVEPGSADLTADVDFQLMKRTAESKGQVITYGPVDQGVFLKKMEGDTRLKALLENSLPENKNTIESAYKMLTEPDQMGSRFKLFCLFPSVLEEHLKKFPVNGFH